MGPEEWDARYAGEALIWKADPNPFLAEMLDGAAPGRAVDLGCGEGRHAIWLARLGWQATGVDFSKVALDKAARWAEREGVEVDWVLADATSFVAAGPVDLVVVSFLHLPGDSRRRVLAEASGWLGPGGRIFVVGYDASNATTGGTGFRDPERLFSPDDVAAELVGLRIERADRLRLVVDGADGPVEVVDALVVGFRPKVDPG